MTVLVVLLVAPTIVLFVWCWILSQEIDAAHTRLDLAAKHRDALDHRLDHATQHRDALSCRIDPRQP